MYESQDDRSQRECSVADQDRGTPARGRPGPDRRGQDRARAEQGRDRRAQDGDRWPPDLPRGRARQERWQAEQERWAETATAGDDLWPPYLGPGSGGGQGARAPRRVPGERPEREPRGRGRNRLAPALSRAEIVDGALAIADAEGSDAVSMRRIAQVLRAGTMSLYWHVANKDQLLDLMIDALIGEIEVPEPSGDWRADLRTQARNERVTLLHHLWVMDFLGGRPPLGPNTLLHLDRSLALLDDLGLDVATAMNILGTAQTYVLGSVLREMREARAERDQEQIDPAEWQPKRAAWRNRLEDDGRFTRVVRFLDEGIDPDAAETRDERFEFGLDCVIDGIAAKVAESGRASP
jgi:AcrR family transcriptional regulator